MASFLDTSEKTQDQTNKREVCRLGSLDRQHTFHSTGVSSSSVPRRVVSDFSIELQNIMLETKDKVYEYNTNAVMLMLCDLLRQSLKSNMVWVGYHFINLLSFLEWLAASDLKL